MGTWGLGPFENDGASDFIDEASAAPAASVRAALQGLIKSRGYIDVDDGQAGLAACELVALGLGYGKTAGLSKAVVRFAAALGPRDDLRELALQALPKIKERKTSELAGLWHEGDDGKAFDALLDDLESRLTAASE